MSQPINTGLVAKLLWPGINAIWGKGYAEHPMMYREIFETETSTKGREEDVLLGGFGLAPVKPEAESIQYDTTGQGPTSVYNHVEYALGFIVTRKVIDDLQYEKAAFKSARALAFSFRQTKENVAANILNRAFNASYPIADGKALIANDHPTGAGTGSNLIGTNADLSEATLEDMAVQIMNATNDRGLKVSIQPRKLVIPTSLAFEATRILKSDGQYDTANNSINALRSMGIFSGGVVVNPYLTDPDAFFILTNAPDGLKHFERVAPEFAQDNDFDTYNLKYKGYERYSFGVTDWHAVYGSPGV